MHLDNRLEVESDLNVLINKRLAAQTDASKSDAPQADATKAGLQEESNPPGSE